VSAERESGSGTDESIWIKAGVEEGQIAGPHLLVNLRTRAFVFSSWGSSGNAAQHAGSATERPSRIARAQCCA
jgi:hypothetical protein